MNSIDLMFEIRIVLCNGTTIEGYINDSTMDLIEPLLKKKRFWRSQVIDFDVYEREPKTPINTGWAFKFHVILRSKNIVLFTHRVTSRWVND